MTTVYKFDESKTHELLRCYLSPVSDDTEIEQCSYYKARTSHGLHAEINSDYTGEQDAKLHHHVVYCTLALNKYGALCPTWV